MSEEPEEKSEVGATEFSHQVGAKAARKLKAQRHVTQTVWSGLGMMGMVGWSVAVPTLLGAALGICLGLGCVNAWHWVAKEQRDIREQEENSHE